MKHQTNHLSVQSLAGRHPFLTASFCTPATARASGHFSATAIFRRAADGDYTRLPEANDQLRCPSTTAFTYAARAFCQSR